MRRTLWSKKHGRRGRRSSSCLLQPRMWRSTMRNLLPAAHSHSQIQISLFLAPGSHSANSPQPIYRPTYFVIHFLLSLFLSVPHTLQRASTRAGHHLSLKPDAHACSFLAATWSLLTCGEMTPSPPPPPPPQPPPPPSTPPPPPPRLPAAAAARIWGHLRHPARGCGEAEAST